jgi:phospholipid/cholesterol/gamma-HCH transport system ATP-binding protein
MEIPLIVFQNVSKQFGAKKVLNHVNLEIYKDQITTIIGKSGSAKSVTLKHIIGLLEPDEGAILFQGKDIRGLSRGERASIYHGISFMFQNNALFDSMTVFDNVAFPLRQTTDLRGPEIAGRVHAKLKQIDLEGVAEKYPAELSGGMQKRVALARALITEPRLVLFDEPTTGQDIVRRNAILSMIAQYHASRGLQRLLSVTISRIFFLYQTAYWSSMKGRSFFRAPRRSWKISIILLLMSFWQVLAVFKKTSPVCIPGGASRFVTRMN